ncbi:MBL fold metallo-hydrolase [Halomonas denitrificans]|nr:MBL fold metallo-hydrolase [Halomonas denitrificans]
MAMFLEKVKTPGLAHLSWVIGDADQAAVIDPRRDIDVYLEIAKSQGARITHVIETHRNEDLVSGAPMLAERTGARVLHGPNADQEIRYAETVRESDCIELGNLVLKILETPGHTDDSISIAIHDENNPGDAVGVFTGDALFIGDVGRTDFYPDRAEEVAGKLFDSLNKLLALGDQAIIYPAHGAGSVCGSGMAEREFSTIGHERLHNSMLQIRDREEFIEAKLDEMHYQPPYFRRMERLNAEGGSRLPTPMGLTPLDPETLLARRDEGCDVIDIRSPESYAGAHVEGALSLPLGLITAYAGWLLDPDRSLVLVADDLDQAGEALVHFGRIGYDRVEGAYSGGMAAWAASGNAFDSVPLVDAGDVSQRVGESKDLWQLLDVRKKEEFDRTAIEGACHIYLGHLADRLDSLDRDKAFTVLCGSGMRAMVGASLLRRNGFDRVDVFLGSMGAWTNR